jgi:dTDP-4-dehydrorhamnose reductase
VVQTHAAFKKNTATTEQLDTNLKKRQMEIWGGLECTINRVGNQYFDQLAHVNHYQRSGDLKLIGELGIKKIRYPILWEKHQPNEQQAIQWEVEPQLNDLRAQKIEVIAGLVHHGSGPSYVNILHNNFAEKLAVYAKHVAEKFPWINYYTPVNEPLTTARFCGLYGIWFPHEKSDSTFLKILLNECKATILAMQAIRTVNQEAKLVFTEDLGKIHSTALLRDQANFENQRRWLSVDLVCGKVDEKHPLYDFLINCGITTAELQFFTENAMPPDVLGFNYYITSERFLDEDLTQYPAHTHGGNHQFSYADVEAVRTEKVEMDGAEKLLTAAWERYHLPMAITEAHLNCGREDQLRWLQQTFEAAKNLNERNIPVLAVTFWALFGAHDWDKLLTTGKGNYESGAFDLTSGRPRATAIAKQIQSLAKHQTYHHPVIDCPGWWQRPHRILYGKRISNFNSFENACKPLLIIGANGTLGKAFMRICEERAIYYKAVTRHELDMINPAQIDAVINQYQPWAIVNAAGFVRVDDAEQAFKDCFSSNTDGPFHLANACKTRGIQLLTFSSDLVFDGEKQTGYVEQDPVNPLNVYGMSKAKAEEQLLMHYPETLIVRTSAFFSPWDEHNFVYHTLKQLRNKQRIQAAADVFISPTYVPDLVDACLDLLIDEANGIWHLANDGIVSWYELAKAVADRDHLEPSLIEPVPVALLDLKAKRPLFSGLSSNRGISMPSLDHALTRFFQAG